MAGRIITPKTSLNTMNIVHVAPEFSPFTRNSGMGRIVRNLCTDQINRGAKSVSVYLPKTNELNNAERLSQQNIDILLRNSPVKMNISRLKLPMEDPNMNELSIFMVENPIVDIFKNFDIDNTGGLIEPWILFSKAVLKHSAETDGSAGKVIHCHGWQTGLLPVYFSMMEPKDIHSGIVFTPHNYKALGTFVSDQWHLTELPEHLFNMQSLEYLNKICLLKAGFKAEMILFADDEHLLKAITGSDADSPAGIGDFIKVHRDYGRVFGILPAVPGIDNELVPIPLGFGSAVADAYRLLLLKDRHAMTFFDVLKERKLEDLYKYGRSGQFNPARNRISLNLNKDLPVIQRDLALSNMAKAANLDEIKKNAETGRYPLMRFESPLHYLPESEEQPFKVLSEEERQEVLDPATSPEKRSEIMTKASRQLLALYLLDRTVNAIDKPINDHHLDKIIDKGLEKSIYDDNKLLRIIDLAGRLKKLTMEEANTLRMLVHYIKNGQTRKIWQANEILKKLNLRLTFNRGSISLISTKGNRNKGRLIILSGMSGVGKGTIFQAAKTMGIKTTKVILYNTREPRPGEEDGREYNFIKADQATVDEIYKMSANQRFELLDEALKKIGINPSSKGDRIEDDRIMWTRNKLRAEYVPVNDDPKEVFDRKVGRLAKVKTFLQLYDKGELCAVCVVGRHFQAVSSKLFDQVNSEPKVFLLEADVNLAAQIVNNEIYPRLDSMSIMIVPPSGKELLSRLLNRNTELAQELLYRYEDATEVLKKSKDNRVHDFYLENDDELRAAYELMGLTGTSENIKQKIWKQYNGHEVARAHHDLIQQMRDSQKIFNADFNNVNLSPSENALKEISQTILRSLQTLNKPYANSPMIIEAIKEYADKHPEEQKFFQYYLGIRPGSDNPIHFGHITSGLAPIIALRLNGVVFATGGKVPDKLEISAFKHRYAMTQIGLENFSNWLSQTDIRNITAKLADTINPATGKSIMGETALQQRSLADIVAFSWLRIMNPLIKWVYITGSDKINKYAKEDERELVLGTLKELNFVVVYLERDMEPVNYHTVRSCEWLKQLFDEGFFSKCPVPQFSGLSSTDIRKQIITNDPSLRTELDFEVLSYLNSSNLAKVFRFAAETEEKLAQDVNYRSSEEYRSKLEELRKEGLID